jgi:polar amino acid transport system permease protein
MIDMQLIMDSLPYLGRGILVTLQISAFACAMGLVIGTMCGLALSSNNLLLRSIVTIYTTIFRGTPMLIQIIFATLVLPTLGIAFSPLWSVILAVGLNSGAYIAYIVLSGIKSISVGQREAGKTLGMNNIQIIRYIVLPQALRVVLPALGNEFITLIKDSSLASIVGVQELTKEGEMITARTFDALTVFLAIAVCYLVITGILSIIVSHIEQRIHIDARH